MSKTIKPFVLTICLFVITFFLIEAFGNNDYKYYEIIHFDGGSIDSVEITSGRYQILGAKEGTGVRKEKQFNYNALFVSLAVGIAAFTVIYKKAKKYE